MFQKSIEAIVAQALQNCLIRLRGWYRSGGSLAWSTFIVLENGLSFV
jgi:hypothetical protein